MKQVTSEHTVKVLVNNAGAAYYGLHEELNPKKIQEMVRVNLEAPLILTQQLLRTLKKNGGYIINISSVTAKQPSPHGCAYAATKAGLASFSSSLFVEARKYGVKVTGGLPGYDGDKSVPERGLYGGRRKRILSYPGRSSRSSGIMC